jgi:hypothetical protein
VLDALIRLTRKKSEQTLSGMLAGDMAASPAARNKRQEALRILRTTQERLSFRSQETRLPRAADENHQTGRVFLADRRR